jgi:hypothetical protein
VNRVADLLHIHSFYRFDNFRAIVRNRFLIERPEIQEELIKLLGENYFKDVNLDTRPVCLVDYPSPKTDHNDAFLAREQVFLWSDTIDYLTSYYRVIYIEPEWDYDAVEAALRVRNITGTGIPEHIIGGHGSSDGTMFSFRFSGTSNSTNGNFDIKDKPLIAELSHAIAPQGRVIMISCSTAKIDKASGTCIAETLSKALPGRTIIAPSDDAGATLTFNAQGAITGVKYHGARVITYRPDGERESGPYHSAYFIREGFLRVAYNEMKEHPWLIGPVGFFVFWQGVALWRIGASVTKRIRRWVRPESPQEITQEAP